MMKIKVTESLEIGQYAPSCDISKEAIRSSGREMLNDDDLEIWRSAGYDIDIARFKMETENK